MKEIIEKLYFTNRAFITDDYDYCLNYIDKNILPLKIHAFTSNKEIWNSWIIPKKWIVNHAYIKDEYNNILIDYQDNPLHLISYSAPFSGKITKEELMKHLYFSPNIINAIPWHFRLNYRPWESEWGFCV